MEFKKYAIGLSLVALSSTSLMAGASPKLVVSGSTVICGSTINQRNKTSGKGGGIPAISIGSSDLYFRALAQTEGGFEYKLVMNINAVPYANKDAAIDRSYLEFGSNTMGTLQVGAVSGVDDTMAKGGLSLIGGAAGIDGTFPGAYNMSSGVNGGVHLLGYTKRANKLSYTTPSFYGFQAGISFTPNTSNAGRMRDYSKANVPGIGNDSGIYVDKELAAYGLANTALGLTYNNTWDDYTFGLSLVGITERSRLNGQEGPIRVRNLRSFQIGALVGYKDFRVASSYFDNGKSRLPYESNQLLKTSGANQFRTTDLNEGNAGKAWDVAAQYTMGAYQFSAGYFETLRKVNNTSKARSQVVTLTADYKALPGLKLFVEADFARSGNTQAALNQSNAMKRDTGIGRNSGNAFVGGTKISF
ncbi:MAG: porin [Alphaproteobacteria bacterium]|nr:porin [Alphaproteobacteria bacterium]